METTTTTQTRKRRSRASNSDDNSGDDGKKRGRPRVEKQDESAADRRRTQIRMAQRAYRQRKESTLEELRKRVSDLTNTLELMNKAFNECCDSLAASGLPESQMQDMRETSMQLEALMRCARNPGEECDAEVTQRLHRDSTSSVTANDSTKASTEPKNVPSWMDETILNNAVPRERPPMEVGLGYTMYIHEGDEMTSTMDYFDAFDQQLQALVPSQKNAHLPNSNSFDAFRVEIPESLSATLTPPQTYSFQESTFGRSLHRACLEQGYQLLLDPQRRPHTYNRVFKLSLMNRDRAKLTAAMKMMLDRGPHEPFISGAPLIHVGGAGTHFPRRDQFGNIVPKKESWNLGVVGPQTLALLENAARDNLTTDMTVNIAGFEGEWFDPYDVEGYLAEKGIVIDPTSSFAEAEVMIWSAPPSSASTSTAATSPKTPQKNGPQPFDYDQIQELNKLDTGTDNWNDFSEIGLVDNDLSKFGLTDIGFSDAGTGSWMNFLQPGEATKQHLPASAEIACATWAASGSTEFLQDESSFRTAMFQKPANAKGHQRKKVIIIDVAKFVKVMTVSGVCIGRSPGFKRVDVDRALALSSFDAF